VALESEEGRALRAAHPELAAVDSLIWLESIRGGTATRALAHSRAVLNVGRYLGGRWALLAWVGWFVPRVLRDAIYRIVARHRN
jgi:predicted DCC family thiol-disulfide oxidoreductase YuxK